MLDVRRARPPTKTLRGCEAANADSALQRAVAKEDQDGRIEQESDPAVPGQGSFKKPCPHCQNLRGGSNGRVSINWSSEERINTMSELATTLYDEEVLHGDEVPDAALELAGSKLWEGPAASFTLSFCSGLDTCPTSPRE